MAAKPAAPHFSIRPRRSEDDDALLRIENRAAGLFREHGYASVADAPFATVADFRAMLAGHEAWVAVLNSGELVGYAVAGPLAGFLHLRELSVDPAHGRRGIGTALVGHVIDVAARGLYPGVTLTTFRDVPFNAPFYARLGFGELALEAAAGELRAAFHREVPEGVDPAKRVLMWRRADLA